MDKQSGQKFLMSIFNPTQPYLAGLHRQGIATSNLKCNLFVIS